MRLLYSIYERRLLRTVERGLRPEHVGIILDGNRRFARERNLAQPDAIYEQGARKLDEVLAWCGELGIGAVTLWVCSTDNLARDSEEVSGILNAVERKLEQLANDPQIHGRRVRVRATGRLGLLPDSLVQAIKTVEAATSSHNSMTLTIAVAYGGREEIADALRALLEEEARSGARLEEVAARLTPDLIGRHMYLADLPDPDLIIRSSGEIRLSGFLLWQSPYSELYFSDVHWPAFRKIDFLRALRSYQQRRRRFGK
jgi:short-chain Z-isoprenyl diphosphate synthase